MRCRVLLLPASLFLLLTFLVTLAPPVGAGQTGCAGRCPLGMSMRHCAGGPSIGVPMRCCLRAPSDLPVRGPEPQAPAPASASSSELAGGVAATALAVGVELTASTAALRLADPRPHQGRWHARGLFTLHTAFLI